MVGYILLHKVRSGKYSFLNVFDEIVAGNCINLNLRNVDGFYSTHRNSSARKVNILFGCSQVSCKRKGNKSALVTRSLHFLTVQLSNNGSARQLVHIN